MYLQCITSLANLIQPDISVAMGDLGWIGRAPICIVPSKRGSTLLCVEAQAYLTSQFANEEEKLEIPD
jgi:hypothetical protein